MSKKCEICTKEIHRKAHAKYCIECAELVAKQRDKQAGRVYRKRKKAKKEYDSTYNADYKKPVEEPKSRLDKKEFFKNRDKSCDDSGYY